MNRVAACCLAALMAALPARAARLDTLQVPSVAMHRAVTVLVAVPDAPGPHPTVYLLHGYGGGAFDWQNHVDLRPWADAFGLLIVTPDGSPDSWYLDSPRVPDSYFETFVGVELPAFVEARYGARRDRMGRGITGLSMGGHGALFLALRHPDTFGAAASMSGGLDLRFDTTAWSLQKHLGAYHDNADTWAAFSVSTLLLEARPDRVPRLLIDCGVDDFFIPLNREVHAMLLARKIPHDYAERPGGHTWDYWVRALPYHLRFLDEGFRQPLHE